MKTKKELIENLQEMLPDNVNIESNALFFLFEDGKIGSFTDMNDDYYTMIGVLEDAKVGLVLDVKEQNKARLNRMLQDKEKEGE